MDLERAVHWVGAAAGAVVLLGGLALLFAPGPAGGIPFGFVVAEVATLLAFVLALWVIRQRYNARQNRTLVSDVEFTLATPAPGDEIDDLVYRLTELREGTIEYRERIQERVAEVAIAVLMDRENCSRERAIELLETGAWTDDGDAAAFFTGGGGAPTSMFDDVLERFTERESAYERQLRATVAAIEAAGAFDFGPQEDADGADVADVADGIDGTDGTDGGDDGDGPPSMARSGVLTGDADQRVTDRVSYRSLLDTHHWTGVTAFALIALAAGVLASQPPLILASAVGVGVAGYARVTPPPGLTDLTVRRTVGDPDPDPGDEVEVTVTVENEGDSFLPDLRLVDLVPPNMRVVEGSPRLYTSLRPGAHSRFQYTLVAERGAHEWSLLAVGSGFAGSVEQEAVVEPEGETGIDCYPRLRTVTEVPVRSQTTVYSGQLSTDVGGSGLEFHSVREYRPNDPMRRVNWKRVARTGDLATIDFREERAAQIVLLFDAREGAYVASAPGEQHALDRSVAAASEVYAALADKGDLVGMAAFDTVPCWLGPGAGTEHEERARQLLAHHPAMSPLPPELQDLDGGYVDPMTHVLRQLSSGTQVMLFSPLISEYPAEVARRLDSAGHRVTIISPDPTADRTAGQRLARVERAIRVNRLREYGLNIVDWGDDESLGLTFERASRRLQA